MLPNRHCLSIAALEIVHLQRAHVALSFPRRRSPSLFLSTTTTRPLTTTASRHQAEPSNPHDPDAPQHKPPPSKSSKFWDSVVAWTPAALLGVAALIAADEYYDLKLLSSLGIQHDFWGPDIKLRWAERRIWAAARAAGDDETWRTACFEAARLRLKSRGLRFEEEGIPRRPFWGRGQATILDEKDGKVFLVKDDKSVVHYFCIVMNVDPSDPNGKAKTEATVKYVFDRRLTLLKETGQIKNPCVWEYWTRDCSSGRMNWSWRKTLRSGNTDHDMLSDYFSGQRKP